MGGGTCGLRKESGETSLVLHIVALEDDSSLELGLAKVSKLRVLVHNKVKEPSHVDFLAFTAGFFYHIYVLTHRIPAPALLSYEFVPFFVKSSYSLRRA